MASSARFKGLSFEKSHVTSVEVESGYRNISQATFRRVDLAAGEFTENRRWSITPSSSKRLVRAINRAADSGRLVASVNGYTWHRARLVEHLDRRPGWVLGAALLKQRGVTMDWFKGCGTVKAVKDLYRQLAKEHHPDVSGYDSTSVMQKINAAYHRALEGLHESVSFGSDGKEHTYYYSRKREDALIEKVQQVVGLGLPDDVIIEIVGTWLWVHGNTKPHKAELGKKGAGLRWHGKRGKWYWRQFTGYRRKYSGVDFDTLRHMYGSEVVEREKEQARREGGRVRVG